MNDNDDAHLSMITTDSVDDDDDDNNDDDNDDNDNGDDNYEYFSAKRSACQLPVG